MSSVCFLKNGALRYPQGFQLSEAEKIRYRMFRVLENALPEYQCPCIDDQTEECAGSRPSSCRALVRGKNREILNRDECEGVSTCLSLLQECRPGAALDRAPTCQRAREALAAYDRRKEEVQQYLLRAVFGTVKEGEEGQKVRTSDKPGFPAREVIKEVDLRELNEKLLEAELFMRSSTADCHHEEVKGTISEEDDEENKDDNGVGRDEMRETHTLEEAYKKGLALSKSLSLLLQHEIKPPPLLGFPFERCDGVEGTTDDISLTTIKRNFFEVGLRLGSRSSFSDFFHYV